MQDVDFVIDQQHALRSSLRGRCGSCNAMASRGPMRRGRHNALRVVPRVGSLGESHVSVAGLTFERAGVL